MSQSGEQIPEDHRARRRYPKVLMEEISRIQEQAIAIENTLLDNINKLKADELSALHDQLRKLNSAYKTTSTEL